MADNREITTSRARPALGQSAQARWQRKQQAAGNCRLCGEPRPPELKQLCRECQDKTNVRMKKYRDRKRVSEVEISLDGAATAAVEYKEVVREETPNADPGTDGGSDQN